MTKEQFEVLQEFEEVFTRALNNTFDKLTDEQRKKINPVAQELIKEKYSTCPSCSSGRKRFLKRMANVYFEHLKNP